MGIYNETYSGQLICSHLGGPGNTVRWLRGVEPVISEGTQNVLNINGVETGEIFTCIVSNPAGESSDRLIIRPLITLHPSHRQARVNQAVEFCCNASSYPPPQYEWFKIEGAFPDSAVDIGSRCLTLEIVTFGDEGSYFCSGTSNDVSAYSRRALLTGMCHCNTHTHTHTHTLPLSMQCLLREV